MPGKILKTLFLSKLCLEIIALMSDRDVIKEVIKYRPKDAVDLVKKMVSFTRSPFSVGNAISQKRKENIK